MIQSIITASRVPGVMLLYHKGFHIRTLGGASSRSEICELLIHPVILGSSTPCKAHNGNLRSVRKAQLPFALSNPISFNFYGPLLRCHLLYSPQCRPSASSQNLTSITGRCALHVGDPALFNHLKRLSVFSVDARGQTYSLAVGQH